MEDRVIIYQIIEAIQTRGITGITDGECLDAIIEIIETRYNADWGYK